jgi:hypothetical protein
MAEAAAFDTRFDGHSVMSCEMKDTAMAHEMNAAANEQGLDVWSHSVKAGRNLHLQVPSERREYWENNYGCKAMIEDVQEVIDQQFSHAAMIRGLQGVEVLIGEGEATEDWYAQYHRFGEIVRRTKELADNNKENTKYVASIGKSHEGREIPVIHLTGSNSKAGDGKKMQIWINGGQHAREWIAPASVMYMTEKLLSDYKKGEKLENGEELGESLSEGETAQVQKVKKLLDQFEFVVAPVINPDGYEYSHTGNRLWRKNRRKNDDGTMGVDLNRNWDNHWGEGGASTNPGATDYQGPSVASEPEVKACQDYIRKMDKRVAGIDFHSYGDLILRSKGWEKKPSHDESLLRKVGQDMKASISKGRGTQYKSEVAAGLYPTTGSTDDWMSEEGKKNGKMWGHGWTVELPDSEHGGKGFLLPANQILPASKEMYQGLISFTENMHKAHTERKMLGAKKWEKKVRKETERVLEEDRRMKEKEKRKYWGLQAEDIKMLD